MMSNRLKILFLPAWYPGDEDELSGIFIREHARAVSLYEDVIVLSATPSVSEGGPGLPEVSSDLLEEGVRTIRIRYGSSPLPGVTYLRYLFYVFKGIKYIRRRGWSPDIIHAHIYQAGCPAVLAKMSYNIPVVITEHTSEFLRRDLKMTDIIKARLALNQADIILPVSAHLEGAIRRYGIKNRFRVIPNVVDTAIFFPAPAGKVPGGKRIIFVGLIKPLKGIPQLLAALGRLGRRRRDFVLDVIGDGPCRKEYERLTGELGLEKLVVFHGLKPKKEVAELMKKSVFLVQPSLSETFGVTCIEAMACGKPIVANLLPVLREKINSERGILVPVEDAAALARAMDTMLEHYSDYSSEKISAFARRRYSYEVVGRELSDIYRGVLSAKTGSFH